MDDLFQGFPSVLKSDFVTNNFIQNPPVNIKEKEEKAGKHLRKEYKHQSFKRSFIVDEKINVENINAKYINGILTVNLPKKQESNHTANKLISFK